jgi:hypothetical protein
MVALLTQLLPLLISSPIFLFCGPEVWAEIQCSEMYGKEWREWERHCSLGHLQQELGVCALGDTAIGDGGRREPRLYQEGGQV